jgi:hypothetical protein
MKPKRNAGTQAVMRQGPGFTGMRRTWPVCRELFNSYCSRTGSRIPAIILTGGITLPDDDGHLFGKRLLVKKTGTRRGAGSGYQPVARKTRPWNRVTKPACVRMPAIITACWM